MNTGAASFLITNKFPTWGATQLIVLTSRGGEEWIESRKKKCAGASRGAGRRGGSPADRFQYWIALPGFFNNVSRFILFYFISSLVFSFFFIPISERHRAFVRVHLMSVGGTREMKAEKRQPECWLSCKEISTKCN